MTGGTGARCCPACGALLAVTGRAHCPPTSGCAWVRCSACGVVHDPVTGRRTEPPPRREPSKEEAGDG